MYILDIEFNFYIPDLLRLLSKKGGFRKRCCSSFSLNSLCVTLKKEMAAMTPTFVFSIAMAYSSVEQRSVNVKMVSMCEERGCVRGANQQCWSNRIHCLIGSCVWTYSGAGVPGHQSKWRHFW